VRPDSARTRIQERPADDHPAQDAGREGDHDPREGSVSAGAARGMRSATLEVVDGPARYPVEFERTVTLRDGSRVRIRPIRSDDAPRLIALYDRLSRDTAYQRFFSAMRRLPPDWARMLATVDYQRRLALVAEDAGAADGDVIAVARYEPSGSPDSAEVAFVVQDDWQERGLGTMMFLDLLRAAEARGIRRFCAYVLGDNRRMLDMIGRYGDVERRKIESGVVEIVFRSRARPVISSY
jgi:RimJ/RimL family protein N-acetyltransferase